MSKQRKVEKYEIYWEENVPEDQDIVQSILMTAADTIADTFNVDFRGDPDAKGNKKEDRDERALDVRVVGCIFSKVFDAILEELRRLESKYKDFEINFCDRLVIGYDTVEDEEDEKEGNFMIYLRDLGHEGRLMEFETGQTSLERCASWNHTFKSNTEKLRNIAIAAVKKIDADLDLKLSSSEYIWPIFITTYDTLIHRLKTMRMEQDVDEIEINFISCFKAGAIEGENSISKIYLRPDINSKLFLKNDEVATANLE